MTQQRQVPLALHLKVTITAFTYCVTYLVTCHPVKFIHRPSQMQQNLIIMHAFVDVLNLCQVTNITWLMETS